MAEWLSESVPNDNLGFLFLILYENFIPPPPLMVIIGEYIFVFQYCMKINEI